MAPMDYSDIELNSKPHKTMQPEAVEIQPRKVSRLSIAALILGILSVPTALMPLFGIPISAVCIVVGIVALWRANAAGTQRSFAVTGLVLSIIAMIGSLVFTQIALSAIEGCEDLQGNDFTECVQNNSGQG